MYKKREYMKNAKEIINDTLVKLFKRILFSEEKNLQAIIGKDLSLKEIHVLEAIAKCQDTKVNSAQNVATSLGITAGTLTTAVNKLIQKGLVSKVRDTNDKRSIKLSLTPKGVEINNLHNNYHLQMAETVVRGLNNEELSLLVRTVDKIQEFFKIKGEQIND